MIFYTAYKKEEPQPKVWLIETERIANEFYLTGVVSKDDLKKMLGINYSTKVLYDQNDPEIKMYKAGLLSKRPPSFDEKYSPMLGWKSYYADYGC